MRKELFYNPRLLLERLAEFSREKRRLGRLKNTPASDIGINQLGHLEFLEICRKSTEIKMAFDIGANEGFYTSLLKSIFPDIIIHAFEPIPLYQQEYLKRTKTYSHTFLHKVTAGSRNEKTKMNFAGHASSFFEVGKIISQQYNIYKESELTVEVVKLNDFIAENKIPVPDLMKLDVEGYELETLKGSDDFLAKVKFLILEVSFEERHINQPLFGEIAYYLQQKGFHIYSFPVNIHQGVKIFSTDVLFYNKNLITHF